MVELFDPAEWEGIDRPRQHPSTRTRLHGVVSCARPWRLFWFGCGNGVKHWVAFREWWGGNVQQYATDRPDVAAGFESKAAALKFAKDQPWLGVEYWSEQCELVLRPVG